MKTISSHSKLSEEVQSSQKIVPFAENLFVGRSKETQLFTDIISADEHVYLEFIAVAGQGKTELLKSIYHRASKENYLAAYVDFGDKEAYHRSEIYRILETIATQLDAQVSSRPFQLFQKELTAYVDQLRQVGLDFWTDPKSADHLRIIKKEEDVNEAFHQGLKTILLQNDWKRLVLCLDSTEKAYDVAFYKFEQRILGNYVNNPKFMIVSAGQRRMVWKNDAIRHLIQSHNLPCLEPDEVYKQIRAILNTKDIILEDDQAVADVVWDMTRGHPYSSYRLLNMLTNDFTQRSLNAAIIRSRRNESIKKLIRQVVHERMLEEFALTEEYPPLEEILWHLAPLRHIELGMLQHVLTRSIEQCRGESLPFFNKLLGELQRMYIFERWQFGRGYDLNPTVRNLLTEDMRTNAFNEFLANHEHLIKEYERLIPRSDPVSRIKFIVEALYHRTVLLHTKGQERQAIFDLIHEQLLGYLNTYFKPERFSPPNKPLRLYESLEQLRQALYTDHELQQECHLDTKVLAEDIEHYLEQFRTTTRNA